MCGVPSGPNLRGFSIYPEAMFDAAVLPATRRSGAETALALRFRLGAPCRTPGERLLLTAPYGFRWKIGATATVSVNGALLDLAELTYDPSYPPVAPPHNQIELSFVHPRLPRGSDVRVRGTIFRRLVRQLE